MAGRGRHPGPVSIRRATFGVNVGFWRPGSSEWVSVISGRPLGIAVLSFVWLVACGGTRIGHFSAASAAIAVLAAGPEGGDQKSLRVLIQRTGETVSGGVCIVVVRLSARPRRGLSGHKRGDCILVALWWAAGVGLAGPVVFGGSVQSRPNVDQHSCRGGCRCRRGGIADVSPEPIQMRSHRPLSARSEAKRDRIANLPRHPGPRRHPQNDRDRSDHRCSAPRAQRSAQCDSDRS